MRAFMAMLYHPNRSVKYIAEIYNSTKDEEIKNIASLELQKEENLNILVAAGAEG